MVTRTTASMYKKHQKINLQFLNNYIPGTEGPENYLSLFRKM